MPLHINALSAELDDDLHAHFSRARWRSSPDTHSRPSPRRWTGRAQGTSKTRQTRISVVGPVAKPRSKSRKAMTSKHLPSYASTVSYHRYRRREPKGISEGSIPRCDGYAILTPVLNALDDPAKWDQNSKPGSPFSMGNKMMQSQKIEKWLNTEIQVDTSRLGPGLHNCTAAIQRVVDDCDINDGVCHVFVNTRAPRS